MAIDWDAVQNNAFKKAQSMTVNKAAQAQASMTAKPTPVKPVVPTKKTYVDYFKQGEIAKGAGQLGLATISGAQSAYLNALNAVQDLAKGNKVEFQPEMSFRDYEDAIAERSGTSPLYQKIADKNKALGTAYSIAMEIGSDPIELTPFGFLNDIKAAKGTAQATASYADNLQRGNTFPYKPKAPKQTTAQRSVRPAQRVSPQSDTIVPLAKDTPLKQADDEIIAKVLVGSDEAKPGFKEAVSDVIDSAKRKFIDSGDTVSKIAKETGDEVLYPLYNNARNAKRRGEYMVGVAQTDLSGKPIGKSLGDIFKPIQDRGDGYYRAFQEYLYHRHNIDRMAQNKPVFGEGITADISARQADELLQQYPEFAQQAEDVYTFNRNNLNYRVESGLITPEQAAKFNEMYPHYVPTFRKRTTSKGMRASGNLAEVESGIKRAKGSNLDLLPLHESMARQTMQMAEAGNKNIFANRLIDNATDSTSKYIQDIKNMDEAADIDVDMADLPELRNKLKVYRDGQAYEVSVDGGLYEGLKAISSTPNERNALVKAATTVNTGFKQLITGWSPIFLIRNFARDIQDVGLYSKNLKEFTAKYPAAWKEIATNGELWQQYKALGGTGSSFFDYAKGFKENPSWLRRNTVDRVEELNVAIEQLPRLTEFISTVSKGDGSYDNLMKAMYNAADVTVNFGRSGTWGKTLNSTFVPFFNPAIQGTSKLIRRFTETKGVKGWTELVLKATAMGVAPSLLNEMLLGDDPQYQSLPDREKDINYIIKIGDGEFIKIPKGRVLSLFGSAAQRTTRMVKGETDAWAGWLGTMGDQVAPISPTESNIYSPIAAVRNNKSWFGTPIEPRRLEKYSPGMRFDERTTSVAKYVGEKLGYSPKKIDYLFDAYSGIIGDIAIPFMTDSAERNPLEKAFKIDSAISNKVSQEFYDKMDEVYFAKNDVEGEDKYDVIYRYINKQASLATDVSAQIREIDGSDLPDKEKREKIRELKLIMNGIQQTAIDTIPQFEQAVDKLSQQYVDQDELYREVNREMFGSEYALKLWNKDVYEKATSYVKRGVAYDTYYDAYFSTKDIRSDQANGKSIIVGSKAEKEGLGKSASTKKKEAIDAIEGITLPQRQRLYEAFDVSEKLW